MFIHARSAALAFAASAFMVCGSGAAAQETKPEQKPAQEQKQDAKAEQKPAQEQKQEAKAEQKPVKAAPCKQCKVEVENRYDYQVLVYDRRETSRADVGNLQPLGKALPKGTVVVETKGRPNMGMTVHQDTGVPPTPKGLQNCRLEPARPDTGVDYRYVCGN